MGTAPGQIRLGGCTVDLIKRQVQSRDRGPVGLGPRDADLLAYLLRHRGQVLPRDQLMGAVWGVRSRGSRALDMAVRRLRVLVEPDPAEPRYLRTVHGVGYRLDLGDATAERGVPLPLSVDAFVGRQPELQRLAQIDGPFALLVGPPGVGKSRLALEHALLVRERHAAVWWCELAQADDEASICAVVARSVGVELRGDPALQLGELFAHRGRSLILLDNLEHLHDPVVRLLGRWLGRAPELRVVGTSREPVGIGEVEVEVAPLSPEEGAALFASRAGERVHAGDPRVTTLVAHTCGVPLAIELAAARLRGLSLEELNLRLEQGLGVLLGPATPAARHTSVLHSLTWSWDLLTAHEQRALARLSVFRGGVSLGGAEAVIGASEGPTADLLVQSLVERHLVARVDRGGAARFGLLELVRRFAAGRLAESGSAPEAEALRGGWAARVGRA
ncbi:MAG: winged helix-turn-helix domain-containing protein, partial [Myxococcota bacterium]